MSTARTTAVHETDQDSVAHRVLQTLRQEIVSAQLKPGQVIREAETAARLGVSKTPVREALHALLWEDFVMVFPRRGYVVRQVGMDDLREVMDLRLSIEPRITAIAARVRSDDLIPQLEGLLDRQLDESLPLPERLTAASDFHRAIAATAGNKRAERLLRTYFDETTRTHYLFPRATDHVVSDAELESHRRILDAITARDETDAQSAMEEHLEESNEALLRSF